MQRVWRATLSVLAAAALAAAADVQVRLTAKGADRDPAKAKSKDRIIWTGNNWSARFEGKSPCQNGKQNFSSQEAGQDRICVISAPCSSADRSGCGRYKYTSTADGAVPVDPDIEVEP